MHIFDVFCVSSRPCCWNSSASISSETIRPPWRLPACQSPSRDTAPCPGPSRLQPQRPLSQSASPPPILPPNLASPQVSTTFLSRWTSSLYVLLLVVFDVESVFCLQSSWAAPNLFIYCFHSRSLTLDCLKHSFDKFLALNFTSSLMHWGVKRETSIQKAGELAREWCNGSGLHLAAVIIELEELISPKPFLTHFVFLSDIWVFKQRCKR